MAGIPFDLIGSITSILGVAGLIPLLWMIISYQLPQYKLKQLDAAIEETTTLLETAIQSGFVPGPNFVFLIEAHLRSLRDLTEDLRAQVACATGFRNQCLAAIGGLSRRIDKVCRRVGIIRIRIATTSDQERRKAGVIRSEFDVRSSVAGRCGQDESFSENNGISKYEDLETLELIGSLPPPLVPPNLTTPPPMYSVHTASVQYQPFRYQSGTDCVETELNASSVQQRSLSMASPLLSSIATSVSHPYPRHSAMPFVLEDLPPRGSYQHLQISHSQNARLGGNPAQVQAVGPSALGRGSLHQVYCDDIQAILMDFRQQLLADQRDMVFSMQNAFDGALERTLQGAARYQGSPESRFARHHSQFWPLA